MKRAEHALRLEMDAELVALAHWEVEAIEERMLAGLDREERSRLLGALRNCAESLATGREGRKSG